MGITISLLEAREVLARAIAWADSARRVPQEWLSWTEQVDASPSKTFTVALGTALLAKATNSNIDALALKATSGPMAYSARTIGHGVLVPGAVIYGYDLRATGREPLNNQPFFRYDRIDEIERIHPSAEAYLAVLINACNRINQLEARSALAALAAFLRVRLNAARSRRAVDLRGTGLSVRDMMAKTQKFIESDPEGGRRGQAFVAATFDLASPFVRTARINDPSKRVPGDVQVLEAGIPVLSIEVRQKVVRYVEAIQFAEALRSGEVATGMIAMLDPNQVALDDDQLLNDAESRYGVFLTTAYGVEHLLGAATVWSGRSLAFILKEFPRRMLGRLTEIETSEESQRAWAALFDP